MLELDAKRKDPTHLFKAKGPALLIEERERKRVTRNLPKVDQELAEAMAEYLERNGTPFLVGGQPYDDFILQQVRVWKVVGCGLLNFNIISCRLVGG